MEECRTVEEALVVFSKYYCEDQFRSQYLIGDANGDSVIIEGDSHILRKSDYQLITNFYHSHPELGGFPCERYEIAKYIIEEGNKRDLHMAVSVLENTSQDGKYPTQYSNIYLPYESSVLLFHNSNFNEYLKIDLEKELIAYNREVDIPAVFSAIKGVYPDDGQKIKSDFVEIEWEGCTSSNYEIVYSKSPGCPEDDSTIILVQNQYGLISGLFTIFFIPGIIIIKK